MRERNEDIPLLIRYFLRRYAIELGATNPTISPEAVAFFQEQPWPGNVRELENAVRKAMLLARGYVVSLEDAQATLQRPDCAPPSARQPMQDYIADTLRAAERGELAEAHRVILQTVERELYAQAMQLTGGNITRAAKWLGVTRVTVREKLAGFGLRPEVAADDE